MAAIPTIFPKAFYGLRTGIKGNAQYISDDEILYPIGGAIIAHNYEQNIQRYLKLPEKERCFNIMCLSPSRQHVALTLNGEEKPSIIIYDVTVMKRRKVLSMPSESTAKEIVSLAYTFDGKYILCLLGQPDWMLVHIQWEKGKIMSTARANNITNPTGAVTQIACNPGDNSIVVVVGPQLFRLLTVSDNVWRQYGWSKPEDAIFTCVTWLSFDQVAAGTSDGRLVIIDGGELRAVFKATDVLNINLQITDEVITSLSVTTVGEEEEFEEKEQQEKDGKEKEEETEERPEKAVREITSFSKGFAYSCGLGTVYMFEKLSNEKYSKRNVYQVPFPQFVDPNCKYLNLVRCISVNPIVDRLIVTTNISQIFAVQMWGADITQEPQTDFEIVGERLHHGPIAGLSMCVWKPIFVTCGQVDHTVRIWNYETEKQEIIKQYQDDVYSVAIHPTGLYIVIGFSDKLRFMILMMDDIVPWREFAIRSCRETCFSENGHLFAGVNGNIIQVYSSITFENVYNLKGHNGKVRSLAWTLRDLKMFSCGTEGAVYGWDMTTGKRAEEVISKECGYNCVVAAADGKTSYGAGTDSKIYEIAESVVKSEAKVPGINVEKVAISRSNEMFFIAGSNGSILSLKFPPLQEPLEFYEFFLHNSAILRIGITYDDSKLISCSQDGSLCMWKIAAAGRDVKMDKDFKYSTDTLIARVDLDEKLLMIRDLATRMHELEMEHEYQVRQMENFFSDKMKEIHEGYSQAIEELKEKNEQMEAAHIAETANLNAKMSEIIEEHEQAMINVEANFNAKLIVEYDKYEALETSCNQMRQDYKQKIENIINEKDALYNKTVEDYESKIEEKNAQMEEFQIIAKQREEEQEEMKLQIEEDADHEIVELRASYEQQLFNEKETNLRLRGETGLLKKKYTGAQKDLEEFKHQVHQLQDEQQRFQQTIINLEKDIADLKKDITERDSIIQEKEKRIFDMTRKVQELEKYKFVLNFKITELKNMIEPKDKEIMEKKEQITAMEEELTNMLKINNAQQLKLEDTKEKLHAVTVEKDAEVVHNRALHVLLHKIQSDLHNTSGFIQQPLKLKEKVKELYHKYSEDPDFIKSYTQDLEVQNEFMKQREHLERTVASLKKQLEYYTQQSKKGGDLYKVMEENSVLIGEINKLRHDLNQANCRIKNMESLLGLGEKRMTPKEARHKLQMAMASQEEIHNIYKNRIEELQNYISLLQDKISELMHRVEEQET